MVASGEMPIELGDSWLIAKTVLAVRPRSQTIQYSTHNWTSERMNIQGATPPHLTACPLHRGRTPRCPHHSMDGGC